MDRKHGTFTIIGFDEGGVRGTPDNLRLVCLLAEGGKLAIWGAAGNSNNIDSVTQHGIPCTVSCEYRKPGEIQADKYDPTHWVRQDFMLTVLS